jgi:uncharacterized protein (UPF0332 family)
VKPASHDYLKKARQDLHDARIMANAGLAGPAARTAYFAAFHAAEAWIFEITDRVVKTHAGVKTEFSRLARDEPRISPDMTTFLYQAYKYKEISDYLIGDAADIGTIDTVRAIQSADRFVDTISSLLES